MSPLVDKTTTTAAVVNGTAHIPAWKRIGLKLKYAADTPAPIPIPAAHVPSKKRKHYDSSDSDDEAETRKVTKKKKAKKQKVENNSRPELQGRVDLNGSTLFRSASPPAVEIISTTGSVQVKPELPQNILGVTSAKLSAVKRKKLRRKERDKEFQAELDSAYPPQSRRVQNVVSMLRGERECAPS